MGLLGSAVTFALGAAIGAASGVAVSRLVAPKTGEQTQESVGSFRQEIKAAGEAARTARETELKQQFQHTLGVVREAMPKGSS